MLTDITPSGQAINGLKKNHIKVVLICIDILLTIKCILSTRYFCYIFITFVNEINISNTAKNISVHIYTFFTKNYFKIVYEVSKYFYEGLHKFKPVFEYTH